MNDEYGPDDISYGIDGGYERIYDGVIVWVLKDGRLINRFRGEGSHREARIDLFIERASSTCSLPSPCDLERSTSTSPDAIKNISQLKPPVHSKSNTTAVS